MNKSLNKAHGKPARGQGDHPLDTLNPKYTNAPDTCGLEHV